MSDEILCQRCGKPASQHHEFISQTPGQVVSAEVRKLAEGYIDWANSAKGKRALKKIAKDTEATKAKFRRKPIDPVELLRVYGPVRLKP